ncbi:MAG TPA: OB-fold domain-containing protein [Burkholderiaceae bacterium]|nr:OB-fold domain-containing protein [Burkholderiaceae bacterium]
MSETSTPYRKPLPVIDVWNKPFWDACREHRFVMQRARATGEFWFPPSPVAPGTLSKEWEWAELSGLGTVTSWVVFHQKYYAGFADELPYNVAMVQLDEGPFIFTNLVGIVNEDIRVGQRVRVTFRDASEQVSIPVFEPVGEGAR